MGAQHSLSLRLQVEIESCSHLAAHIGMQKTHGIDEMLGESRWIKPSRDRWRLTQKRSLCLRNHTQLS